MVNKRYLAGHQWLTPVILTREGEIGRIVVGGQPR
jgi:hypothetical protein